MIAISTPAQNPRAVLGEEGSTSLAHMGVDERSAGSERSCSGEGATSQLHGSVLGQGPCRRLAAHADRPCGSLAVAPGSPAAAAGLLPGDELLTLNGEMVRDVIRYQIQADEPLVELEVRRGGLEHFVTVDKAAGAPLGLDLASAVFDRVRTCDNHCPFCFIYQLPPNMRKSLSVKDDDYRLSFLYGNFTTLTRFYRRPTC